MIIRMIMMLMMMIIIIIIIITNICKVQDCIRATSAVYIEWIAGRVLCKAQ